MQVNTLSVRGVKHEAGEAAACTLSTTVPWMNKRLKTKCTLAQNNTDTRGLVYKAVSVSFIFLEKVD